MTVADRAALADRLLVAGLLAWACTDVRWWWRPPGHAASTPVVLGQVALALAQAVPLLWRRRWPAGVAVATVVALGTKVALGQNLWSAYAAVLAAGYGLGAYGGRRLRRATRALAVVALLAAGVVLLGSHGQRVRAVPSALLAASLGMGEVASARRDLAAAEAAHAHDAEAARLGRELHDVIAHQLSAIAVQAGAARVAAVSDPAAAARTVAAIEETARQGLVELNRIVGSLRHDDGDRLDRAPQPRLRDLPTLVSGARAAGLAVDLAVHGSPRPLPSTVELTGYRVVQESVTNALRYAPGAATQILVRFASDGLDVYVEDDGTPGSADGSGHHRRSVGGGRGLAGLAERAAILGGRFEAGPRATRGFAVHVWLPAES